MKLILASSSPRRRELIKTLGIPFEIYTLPVEENNRSTPEETVQQNACLKCRAVSAVMPQNVVLGADTVVFEPESQKILGKPRDLEEAKEMLRLLSGKMHVVYTGVCVRLGNEEKTICESTNVFLVLLSEEDIEQYLLHENVLDKAGAYAVQGLGGMLIKSIEGSPSNVIGLPLEATRRLLQPYGLIF